MGSFGWIVAASALVLGCGSKDAPRLKGDVKLTFGDCAPTTVAFVSGPRPQEFDPLLLDEAAKAALAAVTPKEELPPPELDDPPPPEEDVLGDKADFKGGAFASLTGTGDISSEFDDTDIYGGLLGNEAGEMNGGFGFGRSGYGPGGTGTGWGTIGTGRYGTIGRGSGTGSGYGVGGSRGGMRGRSASVPTVSIGQPNAQGDLDKAIIRRYIKRNIQKIQYCYEKQLLVKASLSGTVLVQFFITPDGNVASSKASGMDPEVANCVASVIKGIEFPKPKGGGGVQVNYPFTFRPAEGSTPAPSRTAKDDPPPPEEEDKPDDGEDESGGTGTAMALDEGKMGKKDADRAEGQYKMQKNQEDPQLARQQAIEQARAAGILGKIATTSSGRVIDPKYVPGLRTPLHAVENELVACFRLQTKPYGVAVLDLATTSVTAHGIDHAGFKTCVGKLTKKLAYTDKAPLRCSVAFGPMAVADAPALDITANAILMMGKKISEPAAVVANETELKIESVYKDVLARKKALLESKAPVTLHGPLIIRPVDATPMKVVTKTIYSVHAADDDAVLAAQRAGEWKLLRPIELPVVPVPVGTGAPWGPGRSRSLFAAFDENVRLSILVGKDAVWIGLSRVNERQKIDAKDTAAIEAAIKAHKASAFFADRADIEIGGEDDATYGKVVAMIDLADKLGFTRWAVMAPSMMSSRFQE